MADQKFTLEEILSEYTPDGKRSGIQKADDRPLAHGKLETEKLLNAATSDRPMPSGSGGYRHVAEQPPQPEEELVDIKSTISHIKAAQSAQRAQEAAASPVMRERFPTQSLQREQVSFVTPAMQERLAIFMPTTASPPMTALSRWRRMFRRARTGIVRTSGRWRIPHVPERKNRRSAGEKRAQMPPMPRSP